MNHRHHPRSITPLCAAVLVALGLTTTPHTVSAASHKYTADETITEERNHQQGFDAGIDTAVVLDITGSGHLTNGGSVNLGVNQDGHGTVRVIGPDARFTGPGSYSTDVGVSGKGTFVVQEGGGAWANTLRVGVNKGSFGSVHVTGAGSRLKARYLYLGHDGEGLLRIDGGAKVDVEADVLGDGRSPGSFSTHRRSTRIEISGKDSQLKANNVRIGGQLLIEDGAQLHSNKGGVYTASSGAGAAVITGTGSRWVNETELDVHTGLDIRNGAALETETLEIKGTRTINSTTTDLTREQLRVTGTGSKIKAANGIRIGELSTSGGTLTISEGGRVEAGGKLHIGGGSYLVLGGAIGGTFTEPTWQPAVAAGELDDSVITFHTVSLGLAFNHTGAITLDNTLRSENDALHRNGGALINVAGTTALTGDLSKFGGRVNVHGGTLVIDTDTYTDAKGYDTIGDAKPRQYMFVDGGTLVLNGESGFRWEEREGDAITSFRTAWATASGSGVLAGTGTVGDTRIHDGGTLSPGHNSVGTFNVDGDLYFNAGGVGREHVDTKSWLAVDLRADGEADKVKVSGAAFIGHGASTEGEQGDTGVRVNTLDPHTSYQIGQRYTVLEAEGGITGGFNDVESNSAFITGALVQTDNAVHLDIALIEEESAEAEGAENNAPPIVFGRVARSSNQRAVAAALDSLPQSGDALVLYNQLLMQDEESAVRAFDELSGELHASTRAMLLRDDFLRAGVLSHLRTGPADEGYGSRAWITGNGQSRSQRSDGNAATRRDHSEGLLLGYDFSFGEGWTVGAAGGRQSLRQNVRDRTSRSEVDALHGGMYAAFRRDALWLRGGVSYTDYDVDTERTLGEGQPWEQTLTARYKAHAVSTFTEAGFDLELQSLTLTPYLGIAQTTLSTGQATEAAGSAALALLPTRDQVWTTTAGVRSAWDLRDRARVEGGLAWQNTSGDRRTSTTQIFATGSDLFTVHAVPLARNVALAELGVVLSPTTNSRVNLFMQGHRGGGERGFAAQASWNVMF
ncbi:autotransporter outer membrane beta-barrel domain-containing protein [Stenotrophomonas oahuensis]|uniref:Autotransporter domain-containing protein n=1 Tax=Stenotrophomonas oahuensis TaxID=3003271 RepID=A0ABY9YJL0_9GAMM|nr:autotransporter domain-containing protein [Stenotrophomonas sp. A5586]WNH50887.1 autotransporter domain-containing protein [Stenotrophomonas sp. A5586]